MKNVETIEDFYKRKFDWMPDNIRNGIGHFNVFKLDPFVGDKAPEIQKCLIFVIHHLILVCFPLPGRSTFV